jgi:hypothetical protein
VKGDLERLIEAVEAASWRDMHPLMDAVFAARDAHMEAARARCIAMGMDPRMAGACGCVGPLPNCMCKRLDVQRDVLVILRALAKREEG